jgi:glycosyltransferase involved in cell wall biosynthesis
MALFSVAPALLKCIPALWRAVLFGGPFSGKRILSPLYRRLFPQKEYGLAAFCRAELQRHPIPAKGEPRRVCYLLSNSLPRKVSGYTVRSQALARAMSAADWDMRLETRPGWPPPSAGNEDAAFPEHTVVDGLVYHHNPGPSHKEMPLAGYLKPAVEMLAARCRAYRPSLIMGTSNYVTGLLGLMAARRAGLPFFYEMRGFLEISRAARRPEYVCRRKYAWEQAMDTLVALEADHVLTLCGAMRRELIRRGVPGAKISLLPNGCAAPADIAGRDGALAAQWNLPPGVPVIGYVGTFNAYEGLELLIQACGRLRTRDFRILLVGAEPAAKTGKISSALREQARELGLADRLLLPGPVPPDEARRYYTLMDICPFPRLPLPVCELVSPLKPLEAMAAGKAALVSDVGGMEEMVEHGVTGLRFAKGSERGLAQALALLLDDKELRAKLAAKGRAWALAERSWDSMAVSLTGLFETLTGKMYE